MDFGKKDRIDTTENSWVESGQVKDPEVQTKDGSMNTV